MISTVYFEAGGQRLPMKLSSRAMVRIEQSLGQGILKVFDHLQGESFSMGSLAQILAALMNDGKGADIEEALDLIDEVGMIAASEAIAPVIEAAFPPAKSGTTGQGTRGKKTRAAP